MAQQSDQRDFLERQLLGNRHWGYVIYRTIYTPESEEAWDAVVAKLEAYMAREVDETLWKWDEQESPIMNPNETQEPPDPSIHVRIRELLQNRIISDKARLDGRSLEEIRKHFNGLLSQGEDVPKEEFCVMIDEEVFQAILHAPEPERNTAAFDATEESAFVKVVDRGDEEEDDEEEDEEDEDNDDHGEGWMAKDDNYEGWMKASMNRLWDLWSQDELEVAYPDRDPFTGEMRVYTGGGYSSEDPLYDSYMNWPPRDMDISSATLPPPPPRDPRIQDLAAMYERMKDRRPVGNPAPLPQLVHQPELDPSVSGVTPVADPVWKAAQQSLKLKSISNNAYFQWYFRNTKPISGGEDDDDGDSDDDITPDENDDKDGKLNISEPAPTNVPVASPATTSPRPPPGYGVVRPPTPTFPQSRPMIPPPVPQPGPPIRELSNDQIRNRRLLRGAPPPPEIPAPVAPPDFFSSEASRREYRDQCYKHRVEILESKHDWWMQNSEPIPPGEDPSEKIYSFEELQEMEETIANLSARGRARDLATAMVPVVDNDELVRKKRKSDGTG